MAYNTTDVFYFYRPDIFYSDGTFMGEYEKHIPWFPEDFKWQISNDLDFVLKQKWKGIFLLYVDQPAGSILKNVLMEYLDYSFDNLNVFCQQFDLILYQDTEADVADTNQYIFENIFHDNKVLARSTAPLRNKSNMVYFKFWDRCVRERNFYFSDTYDPIRPNKYKFDALLGQPKKHRDFIFENLQLNHMLDDNIVTYRYNYHSTGKHLNESLNYTSTAYTDDLDMDFVSGKTNPIAIPWKIYEHTDFSIVAETRVESIFDKIFLSEKTFKPIFAKRLFVFFGQPGVLAYLKSLGFQTFGDIIDESYDLITDDHMRWQQAFLQVLALKQMDSAEIKNIIADRCQYNHDLMIKHISDQVATVQDLIKGYLPAANVDDVTILSDTTQVEDLSVTPELVYEANLQTHIEVEIQSDNVTELLVEELPTILIPAVQVVKTKIHMPLDIESRKQLHRQWKSNRG